jgi:hypothetical protein
MGRKKATFVVLRRIKSIIPKATNALPLPVAVVLIYKELVMSEGA